MRRLRHFVNPILLMAIHSRRADLIRQIQYLKVENEILRRRLPKRVVVTPRERERLIRYARQVGRGIIHLVSIVHPETMLGWLRGGVGKQRLPMRKPGRPRTPEHIEQMVLRIARETGWGYTRILGELKKLGYTGISRSTVVNILKRHGLDPSPHRTKATWDEFIRRHASTLWACDFLPKRVMTIRGWKYAHVLVFIHVKTRLAWVSPSSFDTTAGWVAQQTRSFLAACAESKHQPRLLLHDCDVRFAAPFLQILADADVEPVRLQIRSPNLNAYVERFIQTLQQECLDHFVVFGTKHLDHLVAEFLKYYHAERPHQGIGNVPLDRDESPPSLPIGRILCRHRLGGLLQHYHRSAA